MNITTYRAQTTSHKRGWFQAYRSFLLNPQESIILKLAPLAIIAGTPEILASNLLPGVGEILDLGGFTITAIVITRTFLAVKKYRLEP